MKLTVLGGGGVRLPLLIRGLIREGNGGTFDRVTLFDIEEERLTVMGQLAQHLLREASSSIQLDYTTDLREALQGTDFVFSAIRVGGSQGRVIDERVALRHGVVGQETTGPGGFAMALRTIPTVLKYADIIQEVAPQAWLLNFTNPAGIVTQALIDHGMTRTIGICDSPEILKKRISQYLAVHPEQVQMTYMGLNHLGWVTDVLVDGRSRMAYLLDHYRDLSRHDAEFAAFDPELIQSLGMLPNEYLYYFYYGSDAVRNVEAVGETRGMQVEQLTRDLFSGVGDAERSGDFSRAWEVYTRTMGTRHQTYMQREMHASGEGRDDRPAVMSEDIGYAGIALQCAQNIVGHPTSPMIVNTPNRGALSQLKDSDVVEVSAAVGTDGPHPLSIGAMPRTIEGLVLSVKEYERLTVEAAVTGNRQLAVEALTVHPLVPSHTVAKQLVDEYLQDLAAWLPQFS